MGSVAEANGPPGEGVGDGAAFACLAPVLRGSPQLTFRIETTFDGETTTLRLIGRTESEYLDELQGQVRRHRPRLVLDLDEVR